MFFRKERFTFSCMNELGDWGAMGFEQFLHKREMDERMKADRASALAAQEAQLRSGAPRAWHELQLAVRLTAEGKRYKGELFIWREATGYPASLVLKNLAASFVDRDWDSRTFTVLLSGIPGVHPVWGLHSPDPEFIDVRFVGQGRWLVGASTETVQTAGENSAAEAICKALVTYFDDYQQNRGNWVLRHDPDTPRKPFLQKGRNSQ